MRNRNLSPMLFCISLFFLLSAAGFYTEGRQAIVLSSQQKDGGKKRDILKSTDSKEKAPAKPNDAQQKLLSQTQEFTVQNNLNYALVIGISKYQNLPPEAQLNFADRDAEELAMKLIAKGCFNAENVKLLTNENAKRGEILESLGKLRDIPKESVVLIFFAGHGWVYKATAEGQEQSFLIPYDGQIDTPHASMVRMEEFNDLVRKIRARSVIVISDACKSGVISDVASKSRKDRGIAVKDITEANSYENQSSFIFSAASPSQSALELKDLQHGIFTYHILQALQGDADKDSNGLIVAGELLSHVKAKVVEATQGKQEPESNSGYDYSIPFAILSNNGLAEYQKWQQSDPFVLRQIANFDEAMRLSRLTKPEGLSAFSFYVKLANDYRTPKEIITKKLAELTLRLTESARNVIDSSPNNAAEWDKAVDWLGKVNELSDQDKNNKWIAWQTYCSGMSKYHSDDFARAAKDFNRVLDLLEPGQFNDEYIAAKIARFFRRQSNWEGAARAYALAIKGQPGTDLRFEYADTLFKLDRLADSETQLRLLQKDAPDSLPILKMLGEVLYRQPDKVADSVHVFARARVLAPEDLDLEESYGRTLLKTGQALQAIEPLRNVSRRRLSDAKKRDSALLLLSRAFEQCNDYDRAISALLEASKHESRTVEVYDRLVELFERRGDLRGAIGAARKAAEVSIDNQTEKAKKYRRLAEFYEHAGSLEEAATAYRSAANFSSGDDKAKTSLELHADVLDYRLGKSRVLSGTDKTQSFYFQLDLPGGRNALERLTGVRIDEKNENYALGSVMDVCLRNRTILERLIAFYEEYPEFVRRVEENSIRGGRLELPAYSQQPVTKEAKEILNYLGIEDRKDQRKVDQKEFAKKSPVIFGLGGDLEKLKSGGSVVLQWKNQTIPLLLGIDFWGGLTEWQKLYKGKKINSNNILLAFLKSEALMKFYVGATLLPENGLEYLLKSTHRCYEDKFPDGLYFAGPYLRFTTEGRLHFPGGEAPWRDVLKTKRFTPACLAEIFFLEDEGSNLYLLAALSSLGEAGDQIVSLGYLPRLKQALSKNILPVFRESYDLIDLLANFTVDGNKNLRLPKSVETWLGATDASNVFQALLAKMGSVAPGKSIPAAKQIAALSRIEQERPEWFEGPQQQQIAGLITGAVIANQEAQIELAIDLEMSASQLTRYFDRISTLSSAQPAATNDRASYIRAFQSAFELLRLIARANNIDKTRLPAAVDRILSLQSNNENFFYDLLEIICRDISGGGETRDGDQLETKLISLLSHSSLITINDPGDDQGGQAESIKRDYFRYDYSKTRFDLIHKSLRQQHHARFNKLVRAVAAIDALNKNSNDTAALQTLKTSIDEFFPEPAAPANRKKPPQRKGAVTQTLQENAAKLTTPVPPELLAEIRMQVAPFVGEALLGLVYAALSDSAENILAANSQLIRNHDFTRNPWSSTEYDSAKGVFYGNVFRLGGALTKQALASYDAQAIDKSAGALFVAPAILDSTQLADRRYMSSRGMEYIARSIDLGEDLLALTSLRQRVAEQTFNKNIDRFLSPKRAAAVRNLLNRGDVKPAILTLSASELYFLGQQYLFEKSQTAPSSELVLEPGALGALTRIVFVDRSAIDVKVVAQPLLREINQFGITSVTGSGLANNRLQEFGPYEFTLNVADNRRYAERMLDLKLAVARSCSRRGLPVEMLQNPSLVSKALEQTFARSRETIGSPLPERHWQGLLWAIGDGVAEETINAQIKEITSSQNTQKITGRRWDRE